ncbi:MAG: hypothetical protein ABIA75_09760, partial [Candidatus Neomarinimicrobiota bacterium]
FKYGNKTRDDFTNMREEIQFRYKEPVVQELKYQRINDMDISLPIPIAIPDGIRMINKSEQLKRFIQMLNDIELELFGM